MPLAVHHILPVPTTSIAKHLATSYLSNLSDGATNGFKMFLTHHDFNLPAMREVQRTEGVRTDYVTIYTAIISHMHNISSSSSHPLHPITHHKWGEHRHNPTSSSTSNHQDILTLLHALQSTQTGSFARVRGRLKTMGYNAATASMNHFRTLLITHSTPNVISDKTIHANHSSDHALKRFVYHGEPRNHLRHANHSKSPDNACKQRSTINNSNTESTPCKGNIKAHINILAELIQLTMMLLRWSSETVQLCLLPCYALLRNTVHVAFSTVLVLLDGISRLDSFSGVNVGFPKKHQSAFAFPLFALQIDLASGYMILKCSPRTRFGLNFNLTVRHSHGYKMTSPDREQSSEFVKYDDTPTRTSHLSSRIVQSFVRPIGTKVSPKTAQDELHHVPSMIKEFSDYTSSLIDYDIKVSEGATPPTHSHHTSSVSSQQTNPRTHRRSHYLSNSLSDSHCEGVLDIE
jgi:hypothetical protein